MAASNSASAAANTAAIGTRTYLRAQFGELAEMPVSILRVGSGVCTHSASSSTSKEAFCMVDQPNPGDIQPSFSIWIWMVLKTLRVFMAF